MTKVSFPRFAKYALLLLVSVKVAALGYYLLQKGMPNSFPIVHTQAAAEDKIKITRAFSFEDLKAFELLESRKNELAQKEEQIKTQEKELINLRKDVEEKLDRLNKLQDQIQKNLESMKQTEDARLKHLVGAYSSMKPDKAAGLIEKLEDDTALQLLSAMKSKDVGGILSFVNADKAAKLSQRLARHAK